MEDDLIDTVNYFYKKKKWNEIINLNVPAESEIAHSILWVWPSEENLKFINNMVRKNQKEGILSIGCGSGLFEWLLYKSTDIPVVGIEIDNSWWCSKYSKNKYIPLQFVSMPPDPEVLKPNYALFFCYFNNGSAFRDYIKSYRGDLVIIVGPGKERGSFANPEPFNPDFMDDKWKLLDSQEVKTTGDFIAVWKRQ